MNPLKTLELAIGRRLASATNYPKEAAQIVNDVARTDLKRVLATVLDQDEWIDEIASRSCEHSNGFDKITLISPNDKAFQLRLHTWLPTRRVVKPEDVHNHSWDFTSIVLFGSLRMQQYEISKEGLAMFHYRYGVQPFDAAIKYIAKRRLTCILDLQMMPGSTYTLSHKVFHRALTEDVATATLVLQGPFLSSDASIFTTTRLQLNEKSELPMKWFKRPDLKPKLQETLRLLRRWTLR
jgi:hypothetical protein